MDFDLPEDARELKQRLKRFFETRLRGIAERYGETSDVAPELVKSMAEEGLFRYLIPVDFGGYGIKALNLCVIREELAQIYAPADVTFAMQGLGSYPIVIAGSEIQKRKFLPKLAAGELLSTFALTEPEAGSDVSSISTQAEFQNGYYVLNGTKRFISNGYAANIAILFARKRGEKKVFVAFILEKGIAGFDIARRIDLIAPHDSAEFRLNNCRIPSENLLGKEGDGLHIALRTLDLLRMSVGAAAVGMAKAALDAALEYSKKRVQFGKPISSFQAVSFKLAEMATEIDAARLLVYRAAWLRDRGEEGMTMEASMAKYYATEMAQRAIDSAVQIFGGIGLTKGNPVERLYREVRATRIYEGTTEIQKLIIANRLLGR